MSVSISSEQDAVGTAIAASAMKPDEKPMVVVKGTDVMGFAFVKPPTITSVAEQRTTRPTSAMWSQQADSKM